MADNLCRVGHRQELELVLSTMKIDSISAYIKAEPPHVRVVLKKMYSILKKAAPMAGEKLAWGMPTLTVEGNLVHFAAFKNHMSLFIGSSIVEHFRPLLKKYSTSKSAIQFPYDKPLPAALITKIAKYGVKQNLADAKAKALKKKKKKKR